MYTASVNVPGYLPLDDVQVFEQPWQAWEYLIGERMRDLDDPLNDENDDYDSAIDEMQGYSQDNETGTVYGFTPGYDGDYGLDLGLAYTVSKAERQ